MKVLVFLAAAFLVFVPVTGVLAQHGHSHSHDNACGYCGMDRQKFAHSAMMIEYDDGSKAGSCSIHCAAIDLAIHIDKTPKQIEVGDYLTKKPINAESACWTIGGDLPGVMTKRAKWAFESKADCEKFAQEHGAKVASFDDAVKAAYEDMYTDTKMIRDKRKAMKAKQGGQPQTEKKQ